VDTRHVDGHHVMTDAEEVIAVRTTLALDDDLVAEAQRLTGTAEKSALVRLALRALIERESARRLARLGGSEPDLAPAPRRRDDSA
jgi:Arc/MetJ family transcription regulator